MAKGMRKIRLSTTPTDEALAALQIGDIVYLDGIIYTAREGVYMRVIDDGVDLPLDLPMASAANFHCSPAATQHEDCLLYTSPSPRDRQKSRMPSSA